MHSFDPFDFGLEGLAFVDGDNAVFSDLFHRVGEERADFRVVVGGDSADLRDALFAVLDGDRRLFEFGDDVGDRLVDTVLQVKRIHAGDNRLHAFVEDRFGDHGRGRGAVADDVAGLGSHFADHLSAHIFVRIFEVDFFSDGDAVLGNDGQAEALLDDNVAPAGTEGYFNGAR